MSYKTTETALTNLDTAIKEAIKTILVPSERLTVGQWARKYRHVQRSAFPGPWSDDLTPWLVEIMDVVSNPDVRELVFVKGSQVGGTELELNVLGYYAHMDPCDILFIQTTKDEALKFSRRRISPLFEATPVLRDLYDPNDPLDRKELKTGASLDLVGSNSPAALSSRAVKVLLVDELDRWKASAADEGDPLQLARKRQTTFWDKKLVMVSSPGVSSRNKIMKEYESSDKRIWEVPCVHCGEYQTLKWGGEGQTFGIHWAQDRPDTAEYWCEHNGCVMTWADNYQMQQKGRWIITNPSSTKPGFLLSGINSLFPDAAWPKLAADFIAAKREKERGNSGALQVFMNTVLAEVWQDRGETLKDYELATHQRVYDPNGIAEVPPDTGQLLGSVDVQKNWLKYNVWAWCKDARFALVECDYIRTDPAADTTWDTLTAALNRPFKTRNPHKPLYVSAIAIDTGFGLYRRKIEAWITRNHAPTRPVIGIKGRSTPGNGKLLTMPGPSKMGNYMPWMVDTNAAKELIYEKFKLPDGPGYVSLPDKLDPDEIAQFTAEERIELVRSTTVTHAWRKVGNRRNENLDLFVYVLALTELFGVGGQVLTDKLADEELALAQVTGSVIVPHVAVNASPPVIPPPVAPPPHPTQGIPHRNIMMPRMKRY